MAEPKLKKPRLTPTIPVVPISYFRLLPFDLLLFFAREYHFLHHLARLIPSEAIYNALLTDNDRKTVIQIAVLLNDRPLLHWCGKFGEIEKMLLLRRAVQSNNFQLAQMFFTKKRSASTDNFLIKHAIRHNNIEMLHWLFSHGVIGTEKLIDVALRNGNLTTIAAVISSCGIDYTLPSGEVVKIIFGYRKDNLTIDEVSLLAAIQSGDIAVVKWTLSRAKNVRISSEAAVVAAVESRSLETMKYVFVGKKNFDSSFLLRDDIKAENFLPNYNRYNNIELAENPLKFDEVSFTLRCKYENESNIVKSNFYRNPAKRAKCSRLDIFIWLYRNAFISSRNILVKLCQLGTVANIEAFWANHELKELKTYPYITIQDAFRLVASGKLFETSGLESEMMSAAMKSKNIETLKFLFRNGCGTSSNGLVDFFAELNDFDMIKEIYAAGCYTIYNLAVTYAIRNNNDALLRFLFDHGHVWNGNFAAIDLRRISPEVCAVLMAHKPFTLHEDQLFDFLSAGGNIESYKILRKDDDFAWLTMKQIVELFKSKRIAILQFIQRKRNIFAVRFLCQMIREHEFEAATVINETLNGIFGQYGLLALGKEKIIKLVVEAMFKLDLGVIHWLVTEKYSDIAQIVKEVACERQKLNVLIDSYEKKNRNGTFVAMIPLKEVLTRLKWEHGLIYYQIGQEKLEWHMYKNFKSKKLMATIQGQGVKGNFIDWLKYYGYTGEESDVMEPLREEWKWLKEKGYVKG